MLNALLPPQLACLGRLQSHFRAPSQKSPRSRKYAASAWIFKYLRPEASELSAVADTFDPRYQNCLPSQTPPTRDIRIVCRRRHLRPETSKVCGLASKVSARASNLRPETSKVCVFASKVSARAWNLRPETSKICAFASMLRREIPKVGTDLGNCLL